MPIVIGLFGLLPLLIGVIAEYLCFRVPRRRRFWRALPPLLTVLFVAVTGVGRWSLWTTETVSPVSQLVIFPGVPGVCLLAGCWIGWRLWKKRWGPRVIDP